MVSVTHLILRFAIVQKKFQQTNKQNVSYNDNHIKFEVYLHFWGIWPTVRHAAGTNRLARYLIVLARSKKFPTQNFLVLYEVFLLITAMKVQQG